MNTLNLRPYQQQAIDEIESAIAFGETTVVLDACVSFGKSLVMAELCNTFPEDNIVILLNIEALIDQIAEALQQRNVEYSILKAGRESEFDESKRVQIVFSQTYYARYKKLNLKCSLIYQDELHREYKTQRTQKLLDTLKPRARIGFTGTPYDSEGFALHDSETITTTSMQDLIDQGYLSNVKFYAPYLAEKKDYSKIKKSGNDYSTTELNKISNTKNHMNIMTDSLAKLNLQDKKILVFANSIEQCNFATKHLIDNGYSAYSYHSKTDPDLALAIMDSFKNNIPLVLPDKKDINLLNYSQKNQPLPSVRVLVSVSKLAIGFSVSDVDVGVLLNRSLIKSKVFQQVGRIYRKHENKPYGIILDLGKNISTHGFPHEPYSPPKRTGNTTKDNETIYKLSEQMNMESLVVTLDQNKLEPIDRKVYTKRLTELKSDKTRLSEQTVKQLANRIEIEQDPKVIIAIVAVLFDKIHSQPMTDNFNRPTRGYVAKNGKDTINFVNPDSILWIAEPWLEVMDNDNYSETQKKKWVNALRTRGKNILKEKKSIWSLRFFINFLLEKYIEDNKGVYEGTIYENKPMPENTIPEIDIDPSEIPF